MTDATQGPPPEIRPRSLPRTWPWVVVVFAILALRDTGLWTHPRFWAEEGLRYFEVAWNRPLLEAVTSCPQGYYNFGCQAGTLLALLVPLEHAPLVTTAYGLLVQMLLPLMVLRLARRSGWSSTATVVGMVAVLVAPPLHESWLSSTNSAHHMALAGMFVVLRSEGLSLGKAGLVLVFVSGLSTPYSFSLLPPAVWFAWRRRTRHRTLLLTALLAALSVQAVVMLGTGLPQGRTVSLSPSIAVAAMAVKCYVLPVAGIDAAIDIGNRLLYLIAVDTFWRWSPLVLLPQVLLWAVVLRSRSTQAITMLVGGHVMALVAMTGALGDKFMLVSGAVLGRYFLCVNALHALAALEALRAGWRWSTGPVLVVFLGGSLVQGIRQYCTEDPTMTGPDWRTEVKAWRADPSHPIGVWPDHWFLHLQPR